MVREDRTHELGIIISRINALRDQLIRTDLSSQERMQINDQLAKWRLILAVKLHRRGI